MRLTHTGWIAVALAAGCSDGPDLDSTAQSATATSGDTYGSGDEGGAPDADTAPTPDALVAVVDAQLDGADAPLPPDAPYPTPDACDRPPYPYGDDPYLICMGVLFRARVAYHDQLAAALVGQPPASSGPGASTPTELDLVKNGEALANYAAPAWDKMTAAAADAYLKMEDFDYSFYQDKVLSDPSLLACSNLIASLPSEPGYFMSEDEPSTPPIPPVPPGPLLCGQVNQEPPEPRPNCVGEVHAAWISHVAGEKEETDPTTCADWDHELGLMQATRATGPTARAFSGDRKPAKKNKNGGNCEMKAPVTNFDVGIHAKPFAIFRPMWVRIQDPGQAPKYVKNDKSKFTFDVPNPNGGPMVKRGPTCPAGAELTMRTIAEMNVIYYVHAIVFKDEDGYSWGNDAYQAMIDVDQKCYGPGTQVTNPTTFSIVPSEQDKEIRLKIVKDCEQTEQWNANVDASATMSNKPGVGFGFNGGASSTTKCRVQLDLDHFAFGGCVANQNFSNTSFTTKPQTGAIPIGATYQFFNPADPAGAAPIGYMGMGMMLSGMQTRVTGTPSSPHSGVAASGMATILVDRKKITDKAGEGKVVIQLGSNTCSLLAKDGQRPADECKIPVANWPLLLKKAKTTKPTATDMNDQFNKLVQHLADSAK